MTARLRGRLRRLERASAARGLGHLTDKQLADQTADLLLGLSPNLAAALLERGTGDRDRVNALLATGDRDAVGKFLDEISASGRTGKLIAALDEVLQRA